MPVCLHFLWVIAQFSTQCFLFIQRANENFSFKISIQTFSCVFKGQETRPLVYFYKLFLAQQNIFYDWLDCRESHVHKEIERKSCQSANQLNRRRALFLPFFLPFLLLEQSELQSGGASSLFNGEKRMGSWDKESDQATIKACLIWYSKQVLVYLSSDKIATAVQSMHAAEPWHDTPMTDSDCFKFFLVEQSK